MGDVIIILFRFFPDMVKQKVTIVKNLKAVLGDMGPWVKNPDFLYSGRAGNFKLLPREILANWLLCIVGNSGRDTEQLTFCNDPFGGGDGIILDRESGEQMVTEHIFIPKHQNKDGKSTEDLVVEAVEKKENKGGKSYSKGKHLIIFCDGIGNWFPNKVGRRIQGIHNFSSVWAIGLERVENDNFYFYWVALFDKNHSPVSQVKIDFQQKQWSVENIQ